MIDRKPIFDAMRPIILAATGRTFTDAEIKAIDRGIDIAEGIKPVSAAPVREKVSDHFYRDELTQSQTAKDLGISNEPSPQHWRNLETYLVPGLEQIRTLCGNRSVSLTNAYRAPKVNAAVGGTATSAHPQGFAGDIKVAGLTSLEVARIIAKAVKAGKLKIDQHIHESGRAVNHVSFDPRYRMMVGHQPGVAGSPINWNYAP